MDTRSETITITRRLPDTATTEDITEELLFRAQVDEGLKEIEAGRC
jgi:hypothetical protein